MKILLAVDGSDYTRKMLDYVCSNRTLFDPSHEYVTLHSPTQVPPGSVALPLKLLKPVSKMPPMVSMSLNLYDGLM